MKKNSLFKVLGITFLVAVLLTWILPTAEYASTLTVGDRVPMGLFDIFTYPLYSLGYFAGIVLFLLAVGGLYGVLEKTTVYPKFLDKIATKLKGKEHWLLIVSAVLFALLASLTGLNFGLFMVFPFVIAVVVALGYDKLTALSVTLGATIVGMFGATFSPSLLKFVNTNLGVAYTDEIIAKIVLFVLGLALLLAFVLMYARKQVAKAEKTKKIKAEKKKEKVKVKKEKPYIWPLVLILSILLILVIAGAIDFNTGEWFTNLHTKIMAVNIKEWPIFARILGGIPAVGSWLVDTYGNPNYSTYTVFIVMASIIIALINRVKFDDLLENFCDGAKKMVVPSALCMLAYTIVIITVYNPVFLNITDFVASITGKFNVATSGLAMLIGSIFNPDMYYYGYSQLIYYADLIDDSSLYPLLSMMFTSLHSLMSLIMPTGILLLASLSYTDVSWTKWMKFIWKVFLGLLVISFITFTIVLLV